MAKLRKCVCGLEVQANALGGHRRYCKVYKKFIEEHRDEMVRKATKGPLSKVAKEYGISVEKLKSILGETRTRERSRKSIESLKTTGPEKFIENMDEGEFWKSLVQSEFAGDLMLLALRRLFERLRASSDELESLKPRLDELETQNRGLLKEIGNLKESSRVLRKQRDDALLKAAQSAFVDHGEKR